MWIEDVNGNLVNLDNCKTVRASNYFVEAKLLDKDMIPVLFESDNPDDCQAYMEQLKKELAAFGKLVKVFTPMPEPENVDYSTYKCTCHKGLHVPPPDHNQDCPYFVPF